MESKIIGLSDLILIRPSVFVDNRGCFFEAFNSKAYESIGILFEFVQDNISKSKQGTLRGLHYQIKTPQGKLLQVIRGKIFDVSVDLRRKSKSFSRWIGAYLSDCDYEQIWIPPGIAHGYYVLSDEAVISYKVTNYYVPDDERVLYWNDSYLKITWPILQNVPLIISERDRNGITFTKSEKYEDNNYCIPVNRK
jgi:dTDP-4-dehydrorhamnose 3,5-epimerase